MEIYHPVKPTILVLEKSPVNLARLCLLLSTSYTVKTVSGGRSVQQVCRDEQPDLVLLDAVHPDSQGFVLCQTLKQDALTEHIPVIFLTAESGASYQQMLMDLGAVDYVARPINAAILLSRVKAQLAVANQDRSSRVHADMLHYETSRYSRHLVNVREMTLLVMASLAEIRDVETGNHLKRTQHYILALSENLRGNPRFSDYLSAAKIETLFKCAPLHDIGKVGIPDRILLKPGRYDPAEFEIMKAHPLLGYNAIVQAQVVAGDSSDFLEVAKEIVYCHHEKWDGSGYPQGLKGEEIPISARLMAIADVYDALISQRVYKSGMSHADAAQIIVEGKGAHFDPDVVDAFLISGDRFQEIAVRFADTDQDFRHKATYQALAL